ncbi:ribosomal protein S16 domain-containing protein [Scheffersomyces amazonensis]|uniref:ribosomal protein S16 domain-containing protein n=1 Tax=Scheffersomyces amazonensis TaxID=1078765 RepID=UPI00315D140B
MSFVPRIKSPIKIRLARFGRKHQPLYNIVVANKKSARDSLPIEVLGTYNPIPVPLTPEEKAANVKPFKHIELDFNRSKYWLGVGADVSDRVSFLFKRAGLLPEDWPSPTKLTQHIKKPVVAEAKKKIEEAREFVRER